MLFIMQPTPKPVLNSGKEYIYFAIKNPSLFRLMYSQFAVAQDDEKLKSMTDLFYTGMLYAAATAFQTSVDTEQSQTMARLAWGMVHGLSYLIIDGQFSHLSNDELNIMIDNVLETAIAVSGK